MARSWQDLDRITMVCNGSYQGYHVKNSFKPFSGIDRVPSWKACLCVEAGNTMVSRNNVYGITSKRKTGKMSKAASWNMDLGKNNMASNTGSYQKNWFATMEPLSRTWLILASLPISWLAFARSCKAMVSLPSSCQNLGKARKELAMDLGKDTLAFEHWV